MNVRTWRFFPIVVPTREGKGLVRLEECDALAWEVWDRHSNECVAVCDNMSDAINDAMRRSIDE